MKFNIYPASDLELRRYELNYCLSMTRMSWDKRPWQSNAYDDVKGDLAEKEAIERISQSVLWRTVIERRAFSAKHNLHSVSKLSVGGWHVQGYASPFSLQFWERRTRQRQ